MAMADIVLRVRLVDGDRVDVKYDEPETADPATVLQHAVSTLANDSGVLRCTHGDRLLLLDQQLRVEATPVAP